MKGKREKRETAEGEARGERETRDEQRDDGEVDLQCAVRHVAGPVYRPNPMSHSTCDDLISPRMCLLLPLPSDRFDMWIVRFPLPRSRQPFARCLSLTPHFLHPHLIRNAGSPPCNCNMSDYTSIDDSQSFSSHDILFLGATDQVQPNGLTEQQAFLTTLA